MVYLTADQHEGHKNIIKYCNRPYKDVDQMRDGLVKKHNSVVTSKDTVFHLGDFSWAKKAEDVDAYLEQLNGKHHLLIGNHDYKQTLKSSLWESVQHYKELKIRHDEEKYFLILCHYPIESWNKMYWSSIHLHGHTHETLTHLITNRLDVSVDAKWTKGYPVNMANILDEITMRAMTREKMKSWLKKLLKGKR